LVWDLLREREKERERDASEREREISADNNCLWTKFPIMKEAELEKVVKLCFSKDKHFLPWKANKSIHHLHFIECSPLMDLGWSIWHFWAYICMWWDLAFFPLFLSLCIIWGGGGSWHWGPLNPTYTCGVHLPSVHNSVQVVKNC